MSARGLAIVLVTLPSCCVTFGTIDVFDADPNKAPVLPAKQYTLDQSQIRALVSTHETCYATDGITVEGQPVGTMVRVAPEHEFDSGWRFFSGLETETHPIRSRSFELYTLNTIANYDPEIIPFLAAPVGSAFRRQGPSGSLAPVQPDTR